MGKQWYNTGYEAADQEKERLARLGGPNRFWMKPGTIRELVLIDDEPFSIYEHQWRANGHWRNWCTCCRDVHDVAPCCEKLGDKSRGFTGFYTIVDCSEHKDAKGTSYQYEVKFLPAKLKTINVLKRKKSDRGTLVGTRFSVARDTEDDPNCGGEFEAKGEADLDKLFKVANYRGKKLVDLFKEATEKPETLVRLKSIFQLAFNDKNQILPRIVPFNYMDILAPREPREIRSMLAGASLDREDDAAPSGGTDSEIPF